MKTPALWGRLERNVAIGSFLLLTLLIASFLLLDARSLVDSTQDEMLGHVGASAGLSVAATGALTAIRAHRPSLSTVLVLGAVLTIALEAAQLLTPNRVFELSDIATGFAGVLITGLLIEAVFVNSTLRRALHILATAATAASAVLLAMIVSGAGTESANELVSDHGVSCPLTTLDGSSARIELGPELDVQNACLETTHGGLALLGPIGSTQLGEDTALASSPLPELADSLIASQSLRLEAEIETGPFSPEAVLPTPALAVTLASNSAGTIANIRTRDERLEVFGPPVPEALRPVAFSPILEPSRRYIVSVELSATVMTVTLDGLQVATVQLDPNWIASVGSSGTEDELTLLIGNNPARVQPFAGTIYWVEIESP